MAKNIEKIADLLGANVVSQLPETGGGAFGAARLGRLVAALRARLEPSEGRRPRRPTDASWVRHPGAPMSEETARKLARLAELASSGVSGRPIPAMGPTLVARLEGLSLC